ncbi:ABC transporter permease [Aquamicrobium sp. LC103]|uniref:ABC transporter permease n=1 Tax=Aquamicrobium sp. LC103 TaxID=1120658 RepID=UPI00063E7B19|nr:ABC transporter permease [Aquamicrobium sp. LC103]TKT74585.1 ABC transporter permease [Aquamicrobium sp. LC103]
MDGLIIRLIAQRIGLTIIILFIVATLVFFTTSVLPGDAAQAILGQYATQETVDGLRQTLGLDRPIPVRYVEWLGGMLTGDAGNSLVNKLPVFEIIGSRMPNTLFLGALTAAIAVPLALFLGVSAAIWRGSIYDRLTSTLAVLGMSTPEFFVATLAVLIFSVQLGWLPALANLNTAQDFWGVLRVLAMPIAILSFVVVAQMARMTRAALLSAMQSSYVEMATLKGASRLRIVLRHAFPNALGPILNSAALALNSLLSGVIFVEIIFNYPGVAKLMVDAVSTRDLPLVQACAMIFCAGYLLLVTVADVAAILANPRLRTGGAK